MRTTRQRRSRGKRRIPGIGACCLLAASAPAALAAQPPRLVYAEALVPVAPEAAQPRALGAQAPPQSTLRFRAYGRTFQLELQTNHQLTRAGADYLVQTGKLPDAPGSWARITRHGQDIVGLLSDGEELFAIEPAAGLAEFIDPDTPPPRGHNLIYRLSDLRVDGSALACGLADAGGTVTAAAAVDALAAEIGSTLAAAAGPVRRITLAPVADVDFASRYGVNAESQIMARLNTIDGIFLEQVGIDIAATAPDIFRSEAGAYPFTASDAATLLGQISDYRLERSTQYGLTHLFTGKRLDNGLAGIAWQGALCATRESAALSSSAGLTTSLSALVAAHEIGHNFGAPHDGEAGSACALTPANPPFLMAPRVSTTQTGAIFSACSLEQISRLIATNPSCLSTLAGYDVALLAPAAVQGSPGVPATIDLTVQNLGARDVSAVSLQVVVPTALAVDISDAGAGRCAAQSGGALCEIDSLSAEADWRVALAVRSDATGRYTVTARAAAAADERTSNDTAQFSVTIGTPAQPGSGGGGTLGWPTLMALALAAVYRRNGRGE